MTEWSDDMETDPTPPAGERAVDLDVPAAGPGAAAPEQVPSERPGMTARAALVGAALVGVWIVLVCYFVHNWNTAQQQFVIIMGFGAMLTLFGLKRVLGLLPAEWRLNRHELVVVYVMLLTAIPLTLIYRGFVESGIHQLQPEQEGRKSYPWVPRHFATRDAGAIESFNYGASDKTWRQVLGEVGGWALPAVYWGVTVLAFELSALGLILILRRKWIEEDRLQFPWATVPGQIVNERYSDEAAAGSDFSVAADEAAGRRRKTAGYLIGLAICVPGLAGAVMPSLASPIGVPPDVQGFGVDLTAYGIIPGSVEFRVVLEPFVLFMLLLLPLDVMISAVLTYVGLRMVLPNVLLFAGLPAYTDRIYRVLMYTMIRAGFMIGIPFWSIYFSRDYLLGVLRKAGIFGAREAGGSDRLLAEFFRVQVLVAVYAAYHLVFDPAGLVDAQRWLLFIGLGWAAWYFCLGRKTADEAKAVYPVPVVLAPPALFYGVYYLIFDVEWALHGGGGGAAWYTGLPGLSAHIYFAAFAGVYYFAMARAFGWPWRWTSGIRGWIDEQLVLRDGDPLPEREGCRRSVMLFAFATAAFARLVYPGMSAVLLVMALGMIFLANFTYARMRAQGLWGILPPWHMMKFNSHMINSFGIWGTSDTWRNSVHTAAFGVDARCLGPHTQLMEGFKLAEETRTRRVDLLKAMGLTTAMVLVMTIPLFLIFAYTFGYDGTSAAGGDWAHYSMWTYFANTWATREPSKEFIEVNLPLFLLLGTAIVGAIMYLRREFIWFPLSPVGCFLGATIGGMCRFGVDRVWFTVLAAFALKAVLFKWYGVRIFQQKILPVVINVLMGLVTGMLIYLVIWAVKGQGVWI